MATTQTAPRPAGTVDDAVAPPPEHPRFPHFDGLRAIAVLAVVIVHSWSASRGPIGTSVGDRALAHLNVGVAIFFVISGFLLYRPFIAHRSGGGRAPSVAAFAKRRALRIYPAFWLALTVLTVVPGLTGVVAGNWWEQYGLVDTVVNPGGEPGCATVPFDCGMAHTWSLVMEATFYVALPLLALATGVVARYAARRRKWVATELALLAGASALSLLLHFGPAQPSAWVVGTVLGNLLWFALGMGLATASVGLAPDGLAARRLGAHPLACWVGAAAVYAFLAVSLPPTPFLLVRQDAFVATLGHGLIALLLVIPVVFGTGGMPGRVLANPVVSWIGLVSYGIFLWHYAVTIAFERGSSFPLVLAVTLAISIPVAAASYYGLERPLLRLKHRGARRVQDPPGLP